MDWNINFQCTGSLTLSDSCVTGTEVDPTMPLCGIGISGQGFGLIGVCGKCQKNSDGYGGDGDGTTQGTCQNNSHKCCSNGSCNSVCT